MEAESRARRAAVFDVDHTLVDGWVGHIFAGYLIRHRPFRRQAWAALLRRGGNLIRSGLQQAGSVETGVRLLAGLREAEVRALAAGCFERSVRGRVFSEGVSEVLRHRKNRHCHTVLASGSSVYIVRAVAAYLGVDAALGSENQVREGCLTKYACPPLCFGEGKLRRVEDHLAGLGISLADTTFYTDSETDLPLLEAVGVPIVVNPSPFLRLTSRGRGWQEEDWRGVR